MTIKKGNPAASTAAETEIKTTYSNTHRFDIYLSTQSGGGAIFDLINQLYDNEIISKECYVAIECTVVEFMHFDEQFERGLITKDLRNECAAYEAAEGGDEEQPEYVPLIVQYTLNELTAIDHGDLSLQLKADLIYGNITQEHYDFMTAYIPIDEQLKLGYIAQAFYNEIVAESWDEYEEDQQDISMGFEDLDTIEGVKDARLEDKLNPYSITTPRRMVLAFKKSVFSEVV